MRQHMVKILVHLPNREMHLKDYLRANWTLMLSLRGDELCEFYWVVSIFASLWYEKMDTEILHLLSPLLVLFWCTYFSFLFFFCATCLYSVGDNLCQSVDPTCSTCLGHTHDLISFRYTMFEVSQTTSSTIMHLKMHYCVHTHCCSASDISFMAAGKYLQEEKPQIKNLPK